MIAMPMRLMTVSAVPELKMCGSTTKMAAATSQAP